MSLAILLLKCKNAPRVTDLTRDWVHQMMELVANYFHDQSGGRERLTFRVFDWFELPQTSDGWDALGFGAGGVVTPTVANGLNVSFASYSHFVLVIDKQGATSAAWDPATRKYCHMAAASMTPALMAHELGHMYGANHANLDTPNGPLEYGDRFCVMGHESTKYTFNHSPLGKQSASGPGMVAPSLVSCGWLNLNEPGLTFDIGRRTGPRRNAPVCELAALRGAPRPGSAGLPVVAKADNVVGEQELLVEFRARSGWDHGIPNEGSGAGWIAAHLTNSVPSGASSLQIGAVAANIGARLALPQAATTVTVAAVDTQRGTVTLQVSTPWFAHPTAVTAWGPNRLDAFGLGEDWQMYHKAWDSNGWYPSPWLWEALGGSFLSPPSVVSWGPNRLDIFALGRNRSMYHKAWDGRAWYPSPQDWELLGGVFTSPPAVAAWGPNRLDIFGLGADSAMYHKAWDGRAWYPSPQDWEPLGGAFTSPPAVVAWGPNRLDIFGLGTDGAMYHKAWDGRGWYPSPTTWELLGGRFSSPPTVATWGPNRLDIFGLGTDGAMYHKAWDGRAWYPSPQDWEPLGGGFALPPTVTSWGPDRLDIFGIGNDWAMYHRAWDGRAWYPSPRDWEPLGGRFISQPSVASWSRNRLDIFGCGTDKSVYHRAWDGNAWHPWEKVGGYFA